MDKREFANFVMALRTYYPKEQILPNDQAMELWYRELQDIPFNVAEAALRKWVSTQKWSPSIAEIREMTSGITHEEIPDWTEGWERCCRAISKYGFYRQKEAMESLDPLTRECVKRLGFNQLCMSENVAADRANFRTCYEALAKRERVNQQMALPLREVIGQIQAQNGLVRLGGGTDEKAGCQD